MYENENEKDTVTVLVSDLKPLVEYFAKHPDDDEVQKLFSCFSNLLDSLKHNKCLDLDSYATWHLQYCATHPEFDGLDDNATDAFWEAAEAAGFILEPIA
jgi:hypothetical protein